MARKTINQPPSPSSLKAPSAPPISPFQAVVQSDGFQDVIRVLEKEHPRHKGLTAAATMEQRAMKQLGDQAYETVLAQLRNMATIGRFSPPESTYEEIK